MLPKIKLSKW